MDNLYQYTQCGLDYIYLEGGWTKHSTPYGEGVSIEDVDQLHRAIARVVVASPQALRGQELRFLRSLLDLSQAGVASVLGTTRGCVARWEGEPETALPPASDRTLRLFYAQKEGGNELVQRICDLLTEIDELQHQDSVMEHNAQGWQARAAA